MKTKLFFNIFIFVVLLIPPLAAAQTTEFTYQGKLTDNSMPANGSYDFKAEFYDALAGGALLGTQQADNVPAAGGIFTITLNAGAIFSDGENRYLQISVKPAGSTNGFTVLSGRQKVTSAPYAIRALNAGAADTATNATTASNAENLGGAAANQFVRTNSTAFVRNQTAPQSNTNFNVSGTGTANRFDAVTFDAATNYRIDGSRVLSVIAPNNTYVGVGTGLASAGGNNSFFGHDAGRNNSLGSDNSFFGAFAGDATTTGSDNSFFGSDAGGVNTGNDNSFFGSDTGDSNTTGFSNSFFGRSAGGANTTGHSNSFFGRDAGLNNTTADGNSFFGRGAGFANTEGGDNSFFGSSAGSDNETGFHNAFFGSSAGANNTGGSNNAFFGYTAGDANTAGTQNSFFGSNAGGANTTGGFNTFVGRNAGDANTIGSNNTVVGAAADVASNNLSYATAIGAGAVVDASNRIQLGRTSGSDWVIVPGRTYARQRLEVGTLSDEASIFVYGFVSVTGSVNAGGGAFNGNVSVGGNLSKGGGSFKIDHPLDPLNKYLYHSFVESPDMMNIYNGNATTDEQGAATVTLPDYFSALNRDFRYQLTVIGQFARAIVAEEIKDNSFVIRTDQPHVKVSWQVTGIRQDPFAEKNRIRVEAEKPEGERGKYLHPEAYEQTPESKQPPPQSPKLRERQK